MYKLIDTIKHEDFTRYLCESDYYKFSVSVYDDGLNLFYLDTNKVDNKVFLPNLYIETDIRTDEFKYISIQTTSYGDLNIEEVEKVIRGLEIAKAEAICLTEFIMNKEWLNE